MKKKVLFVFGTRPEAIKLAPLIRTFKEDSYSFNTKVCVTAQHREMLDQVLETFKIVPDWDLNIMKKNQDLFDITSSVLTEIKRVLKKFKPDLVFVHGDTTSSMAAALASFYQKILVGHVEAGLRTYDIHAPWPEEMNRQITARLSSFHFAPTDNSRQNLLREGISDNKIFVTGNTVIDALNYIIELIDKNPPVIPGLSEFSFNTNNNSRMILITGHRRENFGDGFESVCKAIVRLAENFPEVQFVYPVHLNPTIQGTVRRLIKSAEMNNIHLIKHLGYLPFIALMKRAYLLLTDSGGIQEEAPSLGKPVLVMRKITERPEGLESGVVKMVGTDENLIVEEVSRLLNDDKYYHEHAREVFPYGDGKACMRIYQYIKDFFYNK